MRRPLSELAEAAEVVEVRVRGDRDDRAVEELDQLGAQQADAEAGVHEQVRVPAADQPGVRADVCMHVRLGDAKDAVTDLADLEPPPRDL